MTLPTDQPTGGPAFSPDGKWWWDGGRWVPVTALSPGQGGAPPAQRRSTPGWVIALVVTLVVVLVVPVLLAVAIPVFLRQREVAMEAAVRAELMDAQLVQMTHAVERGTHTSDLGELVALGYEPDAAITVVVLEAATATYCMAAGPAGEAPTVWVTELGVLQDEPC